MKKTSGGDEHNRVRPEAAVAAAVSALDAVSANMATLERAIKL